MAILAPQMLVTTPRLSMTVAVAVAVQEAMAK